MRKHKRPLNEFTLFFMIPESTIFQYSLQYTANDVAVAESHLLHKVQLNFAQYLCCLHSLLKIETIFHTVLLLFSA